MVSSATIEASVNNGKEFVSIPLSTLAKQDGKGIMTNIRYADGKDVQPTDEQVSQWRAAAANQ